jgi:hypothetical protein
VDTGSELNLISDDTARHAGLFFQLLSYPTTIHLALDNKSATPVVLRHFVSTMLSHPPSASNFPDVSLRVSPIKDRYDIILGPRFCLVSTFPSLLPPSP